MYAVSGYSRLQDMTFTSVLASTVLLYFLGFTPARATDFQTQESNESNRIKVRKKQNTVTMPPHLLPGVNKTWDCADLVGWHVAAVL